MDITKEKAGKMLDIALAALEEQANVDAVQKIVADAKAELPEDAQAMERQQKITQGLLEFSKKMLGNKWAEFGIKEEQAMMAGMQIQMMSMTDPDLAPKAQKLMAVVMGKPPAPAAAAPLD